jgi:hypothetical protein
VRHPKRIGGIGTGAPILVEEVIRAIASSFSRLDMALTGLRRTYGGFPRIDTSCIQRECREDRLSRRRKILANKHEKLPIARFDEVKLKSRALVSPLSVNDQSIEERGQWKWFGNQK